jgi:antitoxin ParD1/3/4
MALSIARGHGAVVKSNGYPIFAVFFAAKVAILTSHELRRGPEVCRPPVFQVFAHRHRLSYNEAMAMTSLNISLPEALKEYVEGQVATGDWGTPSEYVRELIRQDKERRLGDLEQELVAAARGPKIEIPLAEIRRKGLIPALRERARRR